ncbi:hypothetical protein [Rathayibacter sp. AY1A3]|uniref:hypothetical protein n=1 Tax=Rathayibacter sp. AY1A3 TaxID=2080521 RepID=UPI0011AFE647|nr:hypothetical protein [Rathayibacter sp. AY1A3]
MSAVPAISLRRRSLALVAAGFLAGVVITSGVAWTADRLIDNDRHGLTLNDVIHDGVPGFTGDSVPSTEACGDRRGCVEAITGDGVSLYRFDTLDHARQDVIYSDADFYRSDRFVLEFDGTLTAEQRYQLLQAVEGAWTGSDD